MGKDIRDYARLDEEPVVRLSLRLPQLLAGPGTPARLRELVRPQQRRPDRRSASPWLGDGQLTSPLPTGSITLTATRDGQRSGCAEENGYRNGYNPVVADSPGSPPILETYL